MALETLWLVPGLALLLLAFVDALWTTMWVDGSAGPLATRLTTYSWRSILAVLGRRHHRALSVFGPVITVAVVIAWVVLTWAGWVLVFSTEQDTLLSTRDYETPADWMGRIYFVGYAMSTMGNGDYAPQGPVWQLMAALTTLSGFSLATLAVSYLLSILSAVVAKRALAGRVTGLGTTAEDFLIAAWDGRSFRTLDLPLDSMTGTLGALTEQHLSYPVLQYYHAAQPTKSPSVGVAILDDALTILRFGVPEEIRPSVFVLRSARSGVQSYLETLKSAYIGPADEVPPPPRLGRLRDAGIPTVSDEEFSLSLREVEDRRRLLLGVLVADGWRWVEVEPGPP